MMHLLAYRSHLTDSVEFYVKRRRLRPLAPADSSSGARGEAHREIGVINQWVEIPESPPYAMTTEQKGIGPTFTLDDEALQQLFDSLWTMGLRPSRKGAAVEVKAMQAHLEDMRRIAFDKLGMSIDGQPPGELV